MDVASIQIKQFKLKTDKKIEWTKRINDDTFAIEIKPINTEQEKVVRKLKKVLDFLENEKIQNEESLSILNKPMDDLLSSLKFLPIDQGPCFNDLPVELKTDILNYTCDSGAFVAAAVCRDWKNILVKRLAGLPYVSIGGCCCNHDGPGGENKTCFMPEEILNASRTLGINIPLEICSPVTNVDSTVLAEGLMSVTAFKIINDDCICREDAEGDIDDEPILTQNQTKYLFEALEKNTKMNSVELKGLDMTHLDQNKLVNCLFKIKKLTLSEGCHADWNNTKPILDLEQFVQKLLNSSSKMRLTYLNLEYFKYPQSLSVDLANALCKVKSVELGASFPLRAATRKQLIKNILSRRGVIESLFLFPRIDWYTLITLVDLKLLITNMKRIHLRGRFTAQQVRAVRSLPGVKVIQTTIVINGFTSVKILKGCTVF